MSARPNLELKIPPALVFLGFAALMYALARVLPVGEFDFFGRVWLQRVLGAAGLIVGGWALVQFLWRKTPVNPHRPGEARVLVTGGLYRYSRNPMYLALLLVLLAWGLYLGNAFNAVTAGLFVSYMNRFQILPEERVLGSRFGEGYRQYCKAVRRWF